MIPNTRDSKTFVRRSPRMGQLDSMRHYVMPCVRLNDLNKYVRQKEDLFGIFFTSTTKETRCSVFFASLTATCMATRKLYHRCPKHVTSVSCKRVGVALQATVETLYEKKKILRSAVFYFSYKVSTVLVTQHRLSCEKVNSNNALVT